MHPAILRTLEDWTTHQDYFWFLGVLAWGAFIAAEIRRSESGRASGRKWLVALAGFQILGALVELTLLAQDLLIPYTKLDFAMGAAQAGGSAALLWGATRGAKRRAIWRGLGIAGAVGLAVARLRWPIEAGLGLCLVQAMAVFSLVRQARHALPAGVALALALAPIVATHGPWATAIDHGRRVTDWSHFALFAAALVLLPGAILATTRWRQRLNEVMPEDAAGVALRRDLRRATWLLLAWLAGGVMLSVWYGARARAAFEQGFLRRIEVAALVLDRQVVAEAFRAELRIAKVETRYYNHGAPIEVVTIPEMRRPVYASLRAQLDLLERSNPDFRLFGIGLVREAKLIFFSGGSRRPGNPYITFNAIPASTADLSERRPYVRGLVISPQFNAVFEARVPLFDPANGVVLGWLIAGVDATRWAATFTQARLQTMALVAVGVGLWTVGIAYRLRREGRDAAERRAAEAAAADRMKSAFLAKVSHELRTPIQSVLGYSELLASAPLGEPHRTWLASLRTHGDVMLRLVNDLIDLGALQSGAFQLERAPVKLSRAIGDCCAAVRPLARKKGLNFEVILDRGLPAWVTTDGVRLRQILLNLLNNAVKFTPRGGVSLDVKKARGDDIVFTIADTGPGIPPEQRARLFQPFVRLDPAAAGGSGLGLALVQGICAAMNGSVRLLDTTEGAAFAVRCPLPVCEPPPKQVAAEAGVVSGLAGVHVLVAEDNSLVRELLLAFLSNAGAQVAVASDGPRALALAREFPPDVVVLDIGLPGLDGIAVAETLRREGTPARIIGLSAHANAEHEARARAAGMDEFLSKPVSLSRLAAVIAATVQRPEETKSSDLLADDVLKTRLLAHFARETPLVLADLRAALEAGDWARLRRSAHYLKNSADVLGLDALQTACQALYVVPDPPDTQEAGALVAAVEAAVPPSLIVLEEPI